MLSGSAYDLRVGQVLKSRNRSASFDLNKPFVIGSGECVTVTTMETINLRDALPDLDAVDSYLFALIVNKHTILATGLVHPATSVDPGFQGPLALTLINLGSVGYLIKAGDRIAKISFYSIRGTVQRLYGGPQQPTVRDGSTDMALTIDRPEEADSDERLSKMYGKPVERLYEILRELERSMELSQLKRGEERRSHALLIMWTVVAGLVSGLIGGIVPWDRLLN